MPPFSVVASSAAVSVVLQEWLAFQSDSTSLAYSQHLQQQQFESDLITIETVRVVKAPSFLYTLTASGGMCREPSSKWILTPQKSALFICVTAFWAERGSLNCRYPHLGSHSTLYAMRQECNTFGAENTVLKQRC